jgi:glycosyltransferase involved in cell wall biosynthesis
MTTHICIGIPTFRRVDSLRELLAAVGRLDPLADGLSAEVVVFENDPERSAESLVRRISASARFVLQYRHVYPPGLSNVRNAALDFAQSHGDLLAMLDDDEVPEPQWLNELLRVQSSMDATVAVGPVRAILPEDVPPWVRAFRDREYPQRTDGAPLTDGWSSNFVLDVAKVTEMGVRFDTTLNNSGGEDQLFFRQVLACGGDIRYAANALAWESLPPARRSLQAILKRSFRRGGSLMMCDQRLKGSRGVLLRLAKGSALVVISLLNVVPTLLWGGISPAVLELCEIARGLGMLAAAVGFQIEAYGERTRVL